MKNATTAATLFLGTGLFALSAKAMAAETAEQHASSGPGMIGATIEAESLNKRQSSTYLVAEAETVPDLRYVGYFDGGSSLCYDNVDLTGVRSIEFEYARGMSDAGRFAILVSDGSGLGARTNLGERMTTGTGGWETYLRRSVGLSRQVAGSHTLCLYGVEGGGIFNLDKFTLSDEPAQNDGVTLTFDTASPSVYSAAGHRFTLEKTAEAEAELWAMAFLPDGSLLATQKNGQLLLLENGENPVRIEGTPKVWNRGQGGLLDVQLHPDYATNGWVYLTYSDVGEDGTTMTRVARGQLDGLDWVNEQIIYTASEGFYSEAYAHFGSRLAFAGDHVYFSIGDRTDGDLAQDLGNPQGKIHRLYADGTLPDDNPFVNDEQALPSIWSYGHRNPQGMATHPHNGGIWSAEHGPRGGDEINRVQKGLNYGWPLVSFGINYDGSAVSESPFRDGTEPPLHHWTPSIGVSQLEFYTGDAFPHWRGQLLVASLGREELHLLRLDNSNNVTSDELLLQGLGRIRDVTNGPDGCPYAVLNYPNGRIYRLVPSEPEPQAPTSGTLTCVTGQVTLRCDPDLQTQGLGALLSARQ